jgi:hypothetical protein
MGRDMPLFGKPIKIEFNFKCFFIKLFLMVIMTGLLGYFWPSFFNGGLNHGALYCVVVAEVLGIIHVVLTSNYSLSYDYCNRAVVVYVFIFLALTLF